MPGFGDPTDAAAGGPPLEWGPWHAPRDRAGRRPGRHERGGAPAGRPVPTGDARPLDILTYLHTVNLIVAERRAAAEYHPGHGSEPASAPRSAGVRRVRRAPIRVPLARRGA